MAIWPTWADLTVHIEMCAAVVRLIVFSLGTNQFSSGKHTAFSVFPELSLILRSGSDGFIGVLSLQFICLTVASPLQDFLLAL